MPRGRDSEAYDRFKTWAEIPMLVAALAIIPLLALPLLVELPDTVAKAFGPLMWGIWSLFVVEYLVLLYLAPDRWVMVRTHLLDLALILLPFLRPFRVVRSLRVLSAAGRASIALRLVTGRSGFKSFGLLVAVVVLSGAVLTWAFERNAEGSTITDLGDALWWATVTATTVGYGDHFPVSSEGRAVAVVLMLLGIGILGVVTANMASYLIESDTDESSPDLVERLERMELLLAEMHATMDGDRRVGGSAGDQPR